MMLRMDGSYVRLEVLCSAAPISGRISSSKAKLTAFFQQPWQKALTYFDGSAERTGRYG